MQRFLDSFGRTLYGTLGFTLGTRVFFRVRREFSVLAEARHNFGCRPKPRAATALEKSLAPEYVYGDLQLVLQHCRETGLKAMLRFSLPTFKSSQSRLLQIA